MKPRFTVFIWSICLLISSLSMAQNVAGTWLGVTYPSDPKIAIFNYFVEMTQNGTVIGGTAQTANPSVPFGGLAYMKGSFNNPKLAFKESNKDGNTNDNGVCYWDMKLTYDPVNETLTGTYDNIINSPYCSMAGSGKVELYRIVLKSGSKFCADEAVKLVVTGKNIRWYDSEKKNKLVATGNTFDTKLTKTTTFYITQTLYNSESPPIPIVVEVTNPEITNIKTTSANCKKTDGIIEITGSGSAALQYSIDGTTFQNNGLFRNLAAGNYKITIKDGTCVSQKPSSLDQLPPPKINDVKIQSPKCSSANGEISIAAFGFSTPLTYSIDGINFQNTATFKNVKPGTYNATVRDAGGCQDSKAVVFVLGIVPQISSAVATPTTCGKDNGAVAIKTSGGVGAVQFSLDSVVFQANGSFMNLKSGDYKIIVRDADGCSESKNVSIAPSSAPKITQIVPQKLNCNEPDGQLQIEATAVTPLRYSIDGAVFQNSNSFGSLFAGVYNVAVKDALNCEATQKFSLVDRCQSVVFLPSSFSPNGDGTNDTFTVQFPFKNLKVKRFLVFNRWGTVIYDKADFTILPGESIWDGKVTGEIQSLPSGAYPFQLQVEFQDGTPFQYQQTIDLIK